MPELDFQTNEMFEGLASSKAYKDFERLVQRALEDQWQEFILSGIVNVLYREYKNYFKRPHNKRVAVRKADPTTVGDIDELKQHEQDTLAADRFIVPKEAIALAPLLLFLKQRVDKDLRSVINYYKFRNEARSFIKAMANKGGQTIIDDLLQSSAIRFRLSNASYITKISERVNTLVKGLDETTKKRLVNALAEGVKKGEQKAAMVTRLQKLGKEISETRAKAIAATETQAIVEYMRFETARLNGVKKKTWVTAKDERVCPVCAPLHKTTAPINQIFSANGLKYPPAHIMCRCFVIYEFDTEAYKEFIDYKGASDSMNFLQEVIHKARDKFAYLQNKDMKGFSIVNVNAVWAGGESLVGPDKAVGNIYQSIASLVNNNFRLAALLERQDDGSIWLDSPAFMPALQIDHLMLDARKNLTDNGFVQLLLRLGIRRKVPPKPKA